MNLREDFIDSHSDPSPDGYRVTRRYRIGDVIAPLAFPDLEIEVARLIPETLDRHRPRPPAREG